MKQQMTYFFSAYHDLLYLNKGLAFRKVFDVPTELSLNSKHAKMVNRLGMIEDKIMADNLNFTLEEKAILRDMRDQLVKLYKLESNVMNFVLGTSELDDQIDKKIADILILFKQLTD